MLAITNKIINFEPGRGCKVIVISMSVCLSVRLHQLKNHADELYQIFCACCPWPWLSPPLTALQYIMYFQFYEWPALCCLLIFSLFYIYIRVFYPPRYCFVCENYIVNIIFG